MLSKIRSYLYPLNVSLFVLFLFFDFRIVNIALVLLLITSFLNVKEGWNDFKNYYQENKSIVFILFTLVMYQLIRAFIGDDLGDKRIGFLGLLLVSFFGLFNIKDIKMLFSAIILILFFLVVGGGVNIYKYFISSDEFNMSTGGHIDPMLIVARPYLGFMLNIGIILSLYMFSKIKGRVRYLYLGSALLFVCYMMFIAIRIQLVSLACIGVIYFIFYNKIKVLYKLGLLILLLFFSIGIISVSPTLRNRFEVDTLIGTNVIDKLAEKEPRIVVWRCASSIVKEEGFSPIVGIGNIGIIDNKLAQCYDDSTHDNKMRQYFLDALFNTHNQFIEYYLLSGAIGVLLLFSLFFRTAVIVRKNFFSIGLLVCLFNFCFVENLLDRQLGAYLFGFTLFLIVSIKFFDNKKEA
ncbi:O-antigen ligase family protein [Myroides odoratimimus]|uniref:O-antigen ligase family protein n=1 Tax=Myroides odoratimimus TaxID=76832 RepID=UPI000469CD59|nr:O-antigen ligase family protein [Myroides odoratimimus]